MTIIIILALSIKDDDDYVDVYSGSDNEVDFMKTKNSIDEVVKTALIVLFLMLLIVISSPLRAASVDGWGAGFADIEHPNDPYTVSDNHFQSWDTFFELPPVSPNASKDEKFFTRIFDTHTPPGPYHTPDTTPGFTPIIEMPQITKAEFSRGYWNLNDAWPNSNKARWYKNRYNHGRTAPAVPIPPAIYLFASGILGLIGVSRVKKR